MSVSLIDGHIDDDAMTDEQIIKALECCTGYPTCPTDCPLYEQPMDCLLKLSKPTLDLINRRQAKIDELSEKLNATIAGQETLQEYIAQRSPLGMVGEG